MHPLPETLLLRTSLKKQLFQICVCVGFVAVSIWMIIEGKMIGWASVLFFGVGIPILTFQMARGGGYLRIAPEGIAIGTGRKEETKYKWDDIEAFGITKIRGVEFVSWNFKPGYDKTRFVRTFNQRIGGMEAMLPDTYGFKAIQLATLLNEYRQNNESSGKAPSGAPR